MKLISKFGLFYLLNPPVAPEGWTVKRDGDGTLFYVTANTGLAWRYFEVADAAARARLAPLVQQMQAELSASFAVTACGMLEIPVPDGRAYRPYQIAGMEYTEERDDVLNADAPRLGKTVQAMGQSNRLSKLWKKRKLDIVIFTPAVAKEHWRREANAWKTHDTQVKKIVGRSDQLITDGINIMNWELVPDYGRELRDRDFDFAIFDEAHALSNPNSQRSKILLGADGKGPRLRARKRLFLTGTPIFTKPWNIFPLVRACDPLRIGKNAYDFGTRYCGAAYGAGNRFDPSGGTNLEELQIRMRRTFMVRREKRDVVAEIPSTRERIVFDKAGFTSLLEEEESTLRAAFEDDRRTLKEILNDITDQPSHEFAPNGVGSSYEALSLAKVPNVVDVVEELLASRPDEKFIIFAHHRSVVSAYAAAFPSGVCVIGGMGDGARQASIDRFSADPTARTAVVSIMAAGAAISLAAADTAIYAELVRSPGAMMQSEERFWLPEKTNPCTIYWAVVEDSADDVYIDVLEERREHIARATDRRRILGTPQEVQA